MSAARIVVGAGACGLGAALAAAQAGPVWIMDRIPVPGGEHGWDHPAILELVRRCERAGVQFALGASAFSWQENSILAMAPGRCWRLPGAQLIFAGGVRPATAAELGLTGDRPAGVVPATLASHLLKTGVLPWNSPIVLSGLGGPWAESLAASIAALGGNARVVDIGEYVAPVGTADSPAITVVGESRVRGLRLGGPDNETLECDALILATRPTPVRNVEGALDEECRDVLYVQPIGVSGVGDRAQTAMSIVAATLAG